MVFKAKFDATQWPEGYEVARSSPRFPNAKPGDRVPGGMTARRGRQCFDQRDVRACVKSKDQKEEVIQDGKANLPAGNRRTSIRG